MPILNSDSYKHPSIGFVTLTLVNNPIYFGIDLVSNLVDILSLILYYFMIRFHKYILVSENERMALI